DDDNTKEELTWNVTTDNNSPPFSVSIQNGTKIILTRLGKNSISAEERIYLTVSDPQGANDSVSLKVLVKKISLESGQINFSLIFILIVIILAILVSVFVLASKRREKEKIEIITEPTYGKIEVGKPEYMQVEYSPSYSEVSESKLHYAQIEQPETQETEIKSETEIGDIKDKVKEEISADKKEKISSKVEEKSDEKKEETKKIEDKIESKKDTKDTKYGSLPAELAEKRKKIDLGLELCETLKFDVERLKNARNKLVYDGNNEHYLESIKIVELYLKIALKKGLPGLIKDTETCIKELDKKGVDTSTLKSAMNEIETRFAEGDYQKLLEPLEKIAASYTLIESTKTKTEIAKDKVTKSPEVELKKEDVKTKEKESDTRSADRIKESTASEDTTKKISRDRLIFLDGRVYIIFEPETRKSYRILKGISEEGAWVSWLTLDAENVVKKYSVPPNIKVKGLGNEPNIMEALLNEIIEYGKGTNRFALLVDFIVSFMTSKNIQSTLRLLSAVGKLIKGKQACILFPISASLLSKEEVSELKKVATIIENPHINWLESPDRTITSVVKCHVCMGVVKANLPIYICPCGKKFHDTCAKRVGECPACGRKI
ncbi:MAG: RING finger protein, partial [Thermoplasmata archaeon]